MAEIAVNGQPDNGDPGINFQGIIFDEEGKDTGQCTEITDQWKPIFTEGCISDMFRDPETGFLSCPPKGPESGDILAPWVMIEFGTKNDKGVFGGGGSKISVSNNSSPNTDPKNTAVISSFEFGQTDGLEVRIVIHDQEGGSFVEFVDNLLRDWNCLKGGKDGLNGIGIPNATMKFQFGWVKSGCKRPYPISHSKCYYAIMYGIDTSFREGKFVAEITGVDISKIMLDGHADIIQGDDGQNKMCLADAIKNLLTNDVPPNVKSVAFRRMVNKKPEECGFDFKEEGCNVAAKDVGADGLPFAKSKGPKCKWMPSSQDKMRTVMRWLEGWSTDGKKGGKRTPMGWVPQYNSSVPGGEVIFWEDAKPNCEEENDKFFDEKCVGSYIVNGSKSSPVLEFNPKIHWDFSRLVSGGGQAGDHAAGPLGLVPGVAGAIGVAAALAALGSKSPGRRDCQTLTRGAYPGAGHPIQITNTECHLEKFNKKAEDEKQKAGVKQIKAVKVLHDDVTAELVIIGDPTFHPLTVLLKYIQIAFINPYYLQIGQGCTDWSISKPPCNEVLSSKAWQVLKTIHKIELGKYTTHITVFLPPGGTDGDVNARLGLWKNGWKPLKDCK